MRAHWLTALVLPFVMGATVTSRQPLPLVPTHQWDFQNDTAAQRGNTAATFVRATASSRIASALYVTVATGTAAISQVTDSDNTLPASTEPSGVMLGEAITFELLRSTALDAAAWADLGTPVVTANNATDILGASGADSIEDDSGAAVEGRTQAVTIADDSSIWQASVWASCVTPHSVDFTLALTGGTPVSTTTTFTCGTTLQKVVAQATNNTTGNVTATVTCRGSQDVASQTGTVAYSFAQLYNEQFETLREEVTGPATVTVNADVLTYDSVAPTDLGTGCVWIWVPQAISSAIGIFEWNAAGGNLGLDLTSSLALEFNAEGVADTMTTRSSTTVSAQTWTHVCVVWDAVADTVKIYKNGTEVAYADAVDSWTDGANYGTTIGFGRDKLTTRAAIELSRVKLWTGRGLNAGQITTQFTRERGKYGQ